MLLSAARVSARVQSLPSEFYAAYLKKFWLAHTAARRFFLRYWLRDLLQEQVVYVRDGAAVVRAADLPAKPAGAVRLCVVSDTHTYHDALRVPPGDALVHCGDVLRADVTRGDGEAQLRRLGAWLAAQDHGRVLVTGGNHDRTLEASSPARVAELLGPRVEYVAHGGVDVGGARLFLSPYSNPNTARSRNSAFQGKTHGDALCANFAKFHASKAVDRAAKESEIPNFKGSDLGHFPLVSADFWTSDRLSERSRDVDAFCGTRARGTLTLKRR